MKDHFLSQVEFSNSVQKYGLRIAIFRINFEFMPSEQVVLKKMMVDSFVKIWGKYLESPLLFPDFTFIIGSASSSFNTYIDDQDVFLPAWRWDKKKKRVYIYNLYSVWIIQFVLRQVMVLLLKGKGFLLHASSVMGKDKVLRGFMAVSGGGKSTTASSARNVGMQHMGDDMLAFIKIDGDWVCYGTKFLEKAFLPVDFQLKSFRLYEVHKSKKQAKSVEIRSFASKLKTLMQQVWMYDSPMDEVDYDLLLDFAKKTQVYKLYLPLKPSNLQEALK